MLYNFSHVWICMTLWTIALKTPLSMWFSRKVYWKELLCPPSRDLSDLGIKPMSLKCSTLTGVFFATGATWEAWDLKTYLQLEKTIGVGEGWSGLRGWTEKGFEHRNLGLVCKWLFVCGCSWIPGSLKEINTVESGPGIVGWDRNAFWKCLGSSTVRATANKGLLCSR